MQSRTTTDIQSTLKHQPIFRIAAGVLPSFRFFLSFLHPLPYSIPLLLYVATLHYCVCTNQQMAPTRSVHGIQVTTKFSYKVLQRPPQETSVSCEELHYKTLEGNEYLLRIIVQENVTQIKGLSFQNFLHMTD